jgi:hypothetical protein
MYYKVVERFGPEDGDVWLEYLKFCGFSHLTRFDSVDGMLRPDLFAPESEEDWMNCVNADFKLSLITNLEYAKKAAKKIMTREKKAELVGVDIELKKGYSPGPLLCGYDIIDRYCDNSLVTNCPNKELINPADILENGLIADFERALELRDLLRETCPDDDHACECEVWAVYRVDM